MALKTLAPHLARCGGKIELSCYGFVVARPNSVTNQMPARVRQIYGALLVAKCGNKPNSPQIINIIATVIEKGNNVHLSVSCVIPEMLRHEHVSSKSCKCWQGFSSSCPKKGSARTMAIKLGWSLQLDKIGFESGGPENSPLKQKGFE